MSFDSNEEWIAKQAYQEALQSPYVKDLERIAKLLEAWFHHAHEVARDPMQAWAYSPVDDLKSALKALKKAYPGKP